MGREFDKYKGCISCRKEIDDVTVRLAKITIGPDTYRHYDEEFKKNCKYEKICTDCFHGKKAGVADVWYGYGSGTHTEENICNPETGQPIPFSSRQGKAEAMRIAGVREVGDRVHGARTTFTNK